jgi:hypothetical protein
MLIVLLFGLADFARIFQAGISLEAATRNASEIAAQEYVQLTRNKSGGILDANDYARLHEVAIDALCAESEILPQDALPVGVTGACQDDIAGVTTEVWPLGAVCVHDGADPYCGDEAASAPSNCPRMDDPASWSTANVGAAPNSSTPLPYVEVRACYQFTTLFRVTDLELPFNWSVSFGTIYLERDRTFTVACYQSAAGQCV